MNRGRERERESEWRERKRAREIERGGDERQSIYEKKRDGYTGRVKGKECMVNVYLEFQNDL